MIIAGITGGIGSGKTTVCREWEKLGAYVFYADEEAKKLMVNNRDVKASIKKTFGDESYNQNGTLNKPHLIKEAFDAGRVEELNAIVHPAVEASFRQACRKAEKKGFKLAVEEAALLLNKGRPDYLDKVIIVLGDERARIKRVMRRDQTTSDKVEQRLKHQPDFEQKKSLADHVIYNNGTLSDLKKEAAALYNQLLTD